MSLEIKISLKSLVSTGTIMGFAALKYSEDRPYSSADFSLFSLSIAVPTSASEISKSASKCLFWENSASALAHRTFQSFRNTLS